MTVVLAAADSFADRLLADARDGLAAFQAMCGRPISGAVLDIGAHYGAFAFQALEAGAKRVVCVEAAQGNYGSLKLNMAANHVGHRVEAIWAAAYEFDPAVARIPVVNLRRANGGNSGQYSVMFHHGHHVAGTVPGRRFTDLLALESAWDYVKVDVEGAEWSLLRDADSVVAFETAEFIDLEVHPLDAAEYYPESPIVPYTYVDQVGEWFKAAGRRVVWTVQHPTRLFIGAKN